MSSPGEYMLGDAIEDAGFAARDAVKETVRRAIAENSNMYFYNAKPADNTLLSTPRVEQLEKDILELKEIIRGLAARIRVLEDFGVKGPKGDKGDPGPQGVPGRNSDPLYNPGIGPWPSPGINPWPIVTMGGNTQTDATWRNADPQHIDNHHGG